MIVLCCSQFMDGSLFGVLTPFFISLSYPWKYHNIITYIIDRLIDTVSLCTRYTITVLLVPLYWYRPVQILFKTERIF